MAISLNRARWKAALIGGAALLATGVTLVVVARHFLHPPRMPLTPEQMVAGFRAGTGPPLVFLHGAAGGADLSTADRLGYGGVELDVVTTKDGEPVVFHDLDLARVSGDPRRIRDLTAAELGRLAATQIEFPLLKDVLDRWGRRLAFIVEIKAENGSSYGAAEAACVAVRARQLEKSVILSSLDPDVVKELATRCRDVTVMYEITRVGQAVPDTYTSPVISVERSLMDDAFMEMARGRFRGISVFTVNDGAEALSLLVRGATLLQTDEPSDLSRLISRWSARGGAGHSPTPVPAVPR